MIKKILHFSCIFFILISSITMADIIDKQEIVRVNDIAMYKNVADKILDNTNSGVTTEKMEDVVIKVTDISISGSELMNVISETYKKVISSNYGGSQETVHVCVDTRLKDGKPVLVHVYVNKKEKLISSLDIEIKKTVNN